MKATNADAPLVAICVATYRRPKFIRDLIESLHSIVVKGFDAILIVVDNDRDSELGVDIGKWGSTLPIPIFYEVEKTRGIASARNRLVAKARELHADYIAFIDDDQVVDPEWLLNLVTLARRTDAAAVFGRWLPQFEGDIPEWIVRSRFFEPQFQATGTRMRYFSTNNVLIKSSCLARIPGPFDVRYDLSGGEDTALSHELHRRGGLIVRCAESIVYERILPARANVLWMFKRQFRMGFSSGSIATRFDRSPRLLVGRLVRSASVVAYSLAMACLQCYRGRAGFVPQLTYAVRGVGSIAGLIVGREIFQEYRQTYGE